MAVYNSDQNKTLNNAWEEVNSPVVKAVQATNNANMAADGKIYATGGSGKNFVYNPQSGNIGVMKDGAWNYVKTGDATYNATLAAMNADTGNLGNLYTPMQQPQQPPEQQPIDVTMNASLKDIKDRPGLFDAYQTASQGIYNNLSKGIDNNIAYQEMLAKQKAQDLERQRAQANRESYVAYQNNINPYGYNAEVMAQMGLDRSGLAESSLVSYGNALMAAIQSNNISYADAMRDLENIQAQARLNGDTQKAQLAGELMQNIASTMLTLGNADIGWRQEQEAAQQERAWKATQNDKDRAAAIEAAELEAATQPTTNVNLTMPQYINGGAFTTPQYPQLSERIESPIEHTQTYDAALGQLQKMLKQNASPEEMAKSLNGFYENKIWKEPMTAEEYEGLAKQFGLI